MIKYHNQNQKRKSYFFLQAGIVYSIYADLGCHSYIKKKIYKKKALELLDFSVNLDIGPNLFWYAITYVEVGD